MLSDPTQVWNWCVNSYYRHGVNLRFPANTDCTKTYQWRYVTALSRKFDQWGFDEAEKERFIDLVAGYCQDHGLLRKGLSVLHQQNLLDSCYKQMQQQHGLAASAADVLASSERWISEHVLAGSRTQQLLQRSRFNGYCQLTIWHNAQKLSELYLALSRSCGKALNMLNVSHPHERQQLPSAGRLWILRTSFCKDIGNVASARQIMAGDLKGTSCRLSSHQVYAHKSSLAGPTTVH
jgi:hypothetical protein